MGINCWPQQGPQTEMGRQEDQMGFQHLSEEFRCSQNRNRPAELDPFLCSLLPNSLSVSDVNMNWMYFHSRAGENPSRANLPSRCVSNSKARRQVPIQCLWKSWQSSDRRKSPAMEPWDSISVKQQAYYCKSRQHKPWILSFCHSCPLAGKKILYQFLTTAVLQVKWGWKLFLRVPVRINRWLTSRTARG